jgi:DUF3025 family protein
MRGGPATLIGRRLFEPLAPWLTRLPADRLPQLVEINALLAESPAVRLADGRPLRCVAPSSADARGYEARILAAGEVSTRPDDWHDYFNALAWRAFPAAKAALNRRHGEEIATRAGEPGRGSVRDALTQFDECGVLVMSSDASLCRALAAHRWDEVLRGRRAEVLMGMDFIVFGHATYDQLRAPFAGLCGKAVYRVVPVEWFGLAWAGRVAEADRWLAAWIANHLAAPAQLSPLPLLGIPGVTPASEAEDFYLDTRQFRPLPPGREPASCLGAV